MVLPTLFNTWTDSSITTWTLYTGFRFNDPTTVCISFRLVLDGETRNYTDVVDLMRINSGKYVVKC